MKLILFLTLYKHVGNAGAKFYAGWSDILKERSLGSSNLACLAPMALCIFSVARLTELVSLLQWK